MKIINKSIALASTIGLAASFSLFAGTEKLPDTKVKFIGTWANLSVYKEREYPLWAERIPAASAGAIKTEVTSFTDMGLKGGEVFRLMEKGVVPFGSTVLGYVAGDDPENEAVDLAGFSSDIDTAKKIADAYKPSLNALYEKKYGIKLLALYPFHAQMMYCRDEIKGLDDLKGKKIRTFSKSLSEFAEAVGATGVTMAFGEVVPGLQRGLVDCAITGALSGNLAKWHEVTNYLYELPVGWSMVMQGANLNAWNSMDPKVRSLIEKEITAWENEAWELARGETEAGIKCNTGAECTAGNKAAMTLVNVSDTDRKRLDEIMRSVIVPRWAERCGADCAADWNQSVGKLVGITAK